MNTVDIRGSDETTWVSIHSITFNGFHLTSKSAEYILSTLNTTVDVHACIFVSFLCVRGSFLA